MGITLGLGVEIVDELFRQRQPPDSQQSARIVSAQARLIDGEWIGRRVDRDFLEYLKSKNIDLCGENGEYHTLVVSGPLFKRRIEVTEGVTIKRDNYWFLDTRQYRLA